MTLSVGDQLAKVRFEPGMMSVSEGKWTQIEQELQHIFRVLSIDGYPQPGKKIQATLEIVE
jgi:hypothetical protein